VVSPDCQRRGIAKKLLSDFMSSHRGSMIKSETWNRDLDHSLLASGFIEEDSIGDGKIKIHTFVPERFREDYFSGLKQENDIKDQKLKRRLARSQKIKSLFKSAKFFQIPT
jgi:hypothetical protein